MTSTTFGALARRIFPELCGVFLGLGFGVFFVFLANPANFFSRLIIVTGPNCGKSELLVRGILADPALQAVFTPLTASDDESDPSAAAVCEVAYGQLVERAPWFRVAGRDWVCRRLTEIAKQYRDSQHGVLPVWVHERVVLDVHARDELLATAGYRLLPGGEGVVRSDTSSDDVERVAPPIPAAAQTEWRGQNIGF
jgi:hypothetical protein